VQNDKLAVIEINRDGKQVYYAFSSIKRYVHNTMWFHFEYGFEIPKNIIPGDEIGIYIWRPAAQGTDTLYIDDFKVEIIGIEDSYRLKM
jgi:hypothetical protein